MNIKNGGGGGRGAESIGFLSALTKMPTRVANYRPHGVVASTSFLWSLGAFRLLSLEPGCLSALWSVCCMLSLCLMWR